VRRRHSSGRRGPFDSLVARVFALLVAGLVLTAALSGLAAWQSWRAGSGAADADSSAMQQRLVSVVTALDGVASVGGGDGAAAQRNAVWALAAASGIRQANASTGALQIQADSGLSEALRGALNRPATLAPASDPAICRDVLDERGPYSPGGRMGCHVAQFSLNDGTPITAIVEPQRRDYARVANSGPRWPWTVAAALALCLLALAWVITRLVLAPLITLSAASAVFSEDVNATALQVRGPREIRAALTAFNRMQSRIQKHITERTLMLAAITHDLQTPLTRLRLRLEKVSDESLRGQLVGDLSACQARVTEGLDLARSLDDRSEIQAVDLDALLASACSEASDVGMNVQWLASSGLTVKARPMPLLRCVENLISNAVKYGHRAEVSAQSDGDYAVIRVRDFGAGIPAADLNRVLEPFVRLETSRSRDHGGTGLGLTIVRNLMHQQHGDVLLGNVQDERGTGLEARLRIPLARQTPVIIARPSFLP